MELAAKVDLSFHTLSVRTFGTQAIVLQPETAVKLIEQTGRPRRRIIWRIIEHVLSQLIGHGEIYES